MGVSKTFALASFTLSLYISYLLNLGPISEGSHLKQHTDGYGYRICLNETSLDEWLSIES
jgi:hypothetical protein